MAATTIQERLEELRAILRSESMSYGELAELQGLAKHIEPDDVELLEAAGVPEFPETIQDRAREAARWFETATRESGDEFLRLRDGRPEWVQDLVFAAHGAGEFMPDDYRYRLTREALEWIADEESDPSDTASEFADQAVDVYTGARLQWLASNLLRPGYCDYAREEFGAEGDIVALIGMGQFMEASEVYHEVLSALEVQS
jgi:hypothetical protein